MDINLYSVIWFKNSCLIYCTALLNNKFDLLIQYNSILNVLWYLYFHRIGKGGAQQLTHCETASKYQNITPLLKQLPWLLIKKEIGFKVKTSTFKCLNDQVPAYLNDLIKLYIPSRYLRSSNQSLLKKT